MSKKDIIDYVMETPGNTNKKVLGRLIDEVEGVKLPEVTEDDNGNVLTVVEGVWDKAEPNGGSGGGVFMVEMGPITDGSTVTELKATWQEIYDALKAGKLVVVHPADDETIVYNSVTLVLTANHDGDTYQVAGITYTNDIAPEVYTCSTPDERPYVGSGQNPGDES